MELKAHVMKKYYGYSIMKRGEETACLMVGNHILYTEVATPYRSFGTTMRKMEKVSERLGGKMKEGQTEIYVPMIWEEFNPPVQTIEELFQLVKREPDLRFSQALTKMEKHAENVYFFTGAVDAKYGIKFHFQFLLLTDEKVEEYMARAMELSKKKELVTA